MPFSEEQGYIPVSVAEILDQLRGYINTQFGTTYTTESFIGTNFYKYAYAWAQRMQENEVKSSEIFLKLQEYITVTNERISRPAVTPQGIIEQFAAADYIASVKPMVEADAGEINICVDVDDADPDYEDMKLEICTIIKDSTAIGNVSQGTETEAIVLSNGQSFDYKFHLPDRHPTLLRLTITLSENNQNVIGNPDDVKSALLANINARYKLGLNFEPQKYFGMVDAPWAAEILLEYSLDDGENYTSDVYDANFDDILDINLEDIELVEA